MAKVTKMVWASVTPKGKIRDCSTDKGWVEAYDDDKIVRATLTVDVPEPKAKKAKAKK